MEKDKTKSVTSRKMTFEEFYKKYYFRLVEYCTYLAYVSSDMSEDIAEEAFLELWRHWDQLESHAEFVLLTWTKKAVVLLCKAQCRKKANEPIYVEFDERIDEEILRDSQNLESLMENQIIENDAYLQYLSEINKRLTSNEQQLFQCLVVREMSVKKAAKYLSKSEISVKVGATRLRAKLRNKILPEILPEFYSTK